MKVIFKGLGFGIAIMALSRAVQRLLTASILGTGYDPVLAAVMSLVISAIVLLPLLFLASSSFPRSWAFWKMAIILGAVNVALPAIGFTLGQQGISATIAGMFVALVPVAVAGFAAIFLRERLTWRGWGGLAFAATCVFSLALEPGGGSSSTVWGLFFSTMAVLTAAWSYVILRKRGHNFNIFQLVAGQSLFAALLSLPLLPLADVSELASTPSSSWILLAALGAASIIIPQLAMISMLRGAPAPKVAVANYITPAITALLALLLLGEAISLAVGLAGFGAVLGAWIVNQDRFSAPVKKTALLRSIPGAARAR